MQVRIHPASVIQLLSMLLVLERANPCDAGESPLKNEKPKLYDTQADGNQQIASAVKTAKAGDKRLLLKFGANW
jgi:hypothetical protein